MSEHKLNTKASGVVAVAVMCSRMLGLVREILFSALFGSKLLGIFIVAFRAPNLLRDLFAEGALSTAFITVFSKKIEAEGPNAAWELAAKMLTLATVFMSVVTVAGIVFAEPLIDVLAAGFAPEYREMTILLTRIMFPFILLVSLAALVMGMLNSRNVFGVPAMASSFFNIGSILGGAGIGWWLDPEFGERALMGLALGTLLGGLMQLAVQLPSLGKVGFRFRPDFRWRDAGVKRTLTLMVPSVIAASAVQVNVLVNTSFATFTPGGPSAVTWLNNAFRLMQLPIGVFGVAVATITLPVVARIAESKNPEAFGPTLGKALRLAVFLTLPSAVGLYFLAHPIIDVIYQRGGFLPEDSLQTGLALQFYAMGLVGYAGVKVFSPTFYAIDRKWTPMLVSFGAILLNIALNYYLIFVVGFGHRGLALSTAVSATLNFLTLYWLMHRATGDLETPRLLSVIVRCGLAAAAMGTLCWFVFANYGERMLEGPLLWRLGILAALIGMSGLIYAGGCWLLRVEAMRDAADAVVRKVNGVRRK
ncbi:MAG: murein biosynthesis integral membrane protein MurJ [Chthoniobacterales bacterium]